MKNLKISLILVILVFLISYLILILTFQNKEKEIKEIFEITECFDLEEYKNYYFINESNKTINVYISVNCCTDEIKVEVEKDYYKILEVEKDGVICRCLCKKIVKIYNANISKKIRFVDYNKNEINLEKEFCGTSTYSYCNSDEDCKINGCSREICGNLSEEIISMCVWRSCYENLKNYRCSCINNKCQWSKIN